MDQIGEETRSRRPWPCAQPVIDGEEGEEPARPVIGVAIQGVGKRDSRRSKLTQAAHQRRAQISPVVAEVEILGLPVWGRVGARGRGSLRVGVLPMRPQERFRIPRMFREYIARKVRLHVRTLTLTDNASVVRVRSGKNMI